MSSVKKYFLVGASLFFHLVVNTQDVIIRKEPDFSSTISIVDTLYRNTFIRDSTGYLQDCIYNTAIGYQALHGVNNYYQSYNTALGAFALKSGKGNNSVAIGYAALNSKIRVLTI